MNNTIDAYFEPHWDSPFTFLRLSEYKFYMCGHISKTKIYSPLQADYLLCKKCSDRTVQFMKDNNFPF
jgi:hypothetical protein